MKAIKFILALTIIFSTSVFAKIVVHKNLFYIESKGNRTPIMLLNTMAESKLVSQVKLFAEGNVNLVAFAKNGETEKLYSVDEQGYIYAIKPFTKYRVKMVTSSGLVQFKEQPKKKYRINSKGFFIY